MSDTLTIRAIDDDAAPATSLLTMARSSPTGPYIAIGGHTLTRPEVARLAQACLDVLSAPQLEIK